MTQAVRLIGGNARNNSSLDNIEEDLQIKFPEDYREFLLLKDGAKPESNIFAVSSSIESSIEQFIPLNEIQNERSLIENLEHSEIPIAWAEGGNYVCLNTSSNAVVFFWDHEEPKTKHRIAEKFSGFLDVILPFNTEDVALASGQVKQAWIDPDFLKSLDQD